MDVLAWSALVNRLYYGESFAAAKAFILANYVTPDSAAQTAAAAEIDANENSGADLVTVGAIAPEDRTIADASWYTLQSAYVTGLDNPVGDGNIGDVYTVAADGNPGWAAPTGSSLPDQAGHSGEFLTTDGTDASWDTVPAGGVTTMAAVGSTPNADGASIATDTLTLQPADATHPGLMTAGTQSFGGAKKFKGADAGHDITVDPTGYFTYPWIQIGSQCYIGSADGLGSAISGSVTLDAAVGGTGVVRFQPGIADFTVGATQACKCKFAYVDISGTPGAGTSSITGRAAVVMGSAAAFDITVTNCLATSVVMVTVEDADATAWPLAVVPGAGKFTVTPAAAATGNAKFRWVIFN